MSDVDAPIWLTAEALGHLQEELDRLTNGDASESEDAARIIELRGIIRRARVGSMPDDGLVEPGMRVTVAFDGDDTPETFLLGARALLGPVGDLSVYSPESPLGQAIAGTHPGDRVEYRTPSGAAVGVTIIAAVPHT